MAIDFNALIEKEKNRKKIDFAALIKREQLAQAGRRDVALRNEARVTGLDKAKQYIAPDRKLTDAEIQDARRILKEYEPQYKTGIKDMFNYDLQKERQNDPNKTAETLRQLEAKISLGSQIGGGVAQVASAIWLAIKDLDTVTVTEKSTYGEKFNQSYVDDPDDAILTDYANGTDFCFTYDGFGELSIYTQVSGDTLTCDIYEN